MTPERLCNPADVDGRADIYVLGAVAYVMLTGRKVFDASDELSTTSLVLNEIRPTISKCAEQPIPPELDDLVAACPEDRRGLTS